jgi:hypothetical protein
MGDAGYAILKPWLQSQLWRPAVHKPQAFNPMEHALVLVRACNDDLEAARNLARTSAIVAESGGLTGEYKYWDSISRALLPTKLES